jgi:hypothetical protein
VVVKLSVELAKRNDVDDSPIAQSVGAVLENSRKELLEDELSRASFMKNLCWGARRSL